ncbi:MAG: hypothetical protein ABJA71_13430 [Ginsengibacter sp.]
MNNWESELERGIAPQVLHGINVNLPELGITSPWGKIDVYDPWKDVWTSIGKYDSIFTLPDFKRSIVVRLTLK